MKAKQISTAVSFLLILLVLGVGTIFIPDNDISDSERRKLTQFATYSELADKASSSGKKFGPVEYFAHLEDYLLDQFPARDGFRQLKSLFKKYVLFQKDNNGYYLADGHLASMDAKLNEKALNDALSRFNSVYTKYFAPIGANAYYAIIPDKNYFTAEANGYLHYDYNKMYEMIEGGFNSAIKPIDIRSMMTLDQYYRTDPHWDQSKILPVADRLLEAMGADGKASELTWQENRLEPFYGTYFGQAALPVEPDVLTYLTAPELDGVQVFGYATNTTKGMYDEAKFEGTDPYDVFLDGAVPLLRITNPAQKNGKQLVIFRDSFGSSITPLLVGEYSEVLVVDIRYISASYLGQVAKFAKGCDVLFLYCTSVFNTYGIFAA